MRDHPAQRPPRGCDNPIKGVLPQALDPGEHPVRGRQRPHHGVSGLDLPNVVLDVGGDPLVIIAAHGPETSPTELAELTALVESVRFIEPRCAGHRDEQLVAAAPHVDDDRTSGHE